MSTITHRTVRLLNVTRRPSRWGGLHAVSLVLWALGPAAHAGDVLLYASTGGDNPSGGGRVYTIDPDSQVVTLIGNTGFDRLGGLAFNAGGVLYGVSGGSAGPGTLMTIDRNNGQPSVIGDVGGIQGVDALAFGRNGTLYGGAWDGSQGTGALVTLDLSNGDVLTRVNFFGGSGNNFCAGLAFDGRFQLYASRGNSNGHTEDLDLVDIATGRLTPIGGATDIIADIWFAPDGRLFGGTPNGDLYRIDPSNGDKTLLFNTGVRISGLTGIPEPATVVLLATGGLVLLRRRTM